ncbi:MAG: DUF3055 domain-containing protein [Candidatus Pristimantibacillus sp.]
MFEQLYDVSELANVHFIGCMTEQARYDFSIVYTEHFFGKPLVICMQTGRSTLLDLQDLLNIEYLQKVFHIQEHDVAHELVSFLTVRLPTMSIKDQY